MDAQFHDVVIVGYGPTGMTLASLLGGMGHNVAVLERWPALYGLPRLTHIDGETARLLSFACDIGDALKDSSPIESFKFYNAKGLELLDVAAIKTTPMGHPAHISIHQPTIEDALDRKIRSYPNVSVYQGAELVSLQPEADHVALTTKTSDGQIRLKARYVFGADGARSFVRQTVGIERDDFGFNERWLNVDGVRNRPLASSFSATRQYCDPARGHMFMPIGETKQRFEFAILSGESTEEMEKESTAWRMLDKYHGVGPDDICIIRQIVYTFECRIAKMWRKGRVFLGGDAAHTMPPYLGQGACSGIRDAANIAWKFDLVLRGKASDAILDEYEKERREHVTYIMKTARSFGKVANTHSKVGAFFRDLIFRLNILPPPSPFPAIAQGVVADKTKDGPGKAIGTAAPQGRVAATGRAVHLDEETGYRFVLISRTNPSGGLSPQQASLLDDVGCELITLGGDGAAGVRSVSDVDGAHTRFLDEMGQHAVLLRPDTNIFGFARTAADIGALVDTLRSKLPTSGR